MKAGADRLFTLLPRATLDLPLRVVRHSHAERDFATPGERLLPTDGTAWLLQPNCR